MIIDNVLYYSFRFFICFAKLTLKAALLLVYLYIIVHFFDKSVKFISFPLEDDALSSR